MVVDLPAPLGPMKPKNSPVPHQAQETDAFLIQLLHPLQSAAQAGAALGGENQGAFSLPCNPLDLLPGAGLGGQIPLLF